MQWDDLRVLLALARAGTLTRAAKQLGVNHTTVSRRIQSLEDQVGVRLFEKLPSGYVPTAAGAEVREVAERMEEEVHRLDRSVLGRDARLAGSLKVTTVGLMAETHAPDLAEFRRKYPLIELELSVGYQKQSLTRREADIAIRLTNQPGEHLVGRRAGRLEFAIFAAPALIDRVGDTDDLAAYPWLTWNKASGASLTSAWMADNVADAEIACRFNDAAALRAAVRAGMGLAFLPVTVANLVDDLVQLRPPQPGFGMDIWMLTHPDLRRAARVRAFMSFFGDRLKAAHPAAENREEQAGTGS
jgi:DNA-binding transcriptional LysR family regulator